MIQEAFQTLGISLGLGLFLGQQHERLESRVAGIRTFPLITLLGIAGYVAYKLFGKKAGTLLGGILDGLISSTATTVSYARRSKGAPDTAMLAALVITIASIIAFAHVIAEVAVVAPGILERVAPPLATMFLLMYWRGSVSLYIAISRYPFSAGSAPHKGNIPWQIGTSSPSAGASRPLH